MSNALKGAALIALAVILLPALALATATNPALESSGGHGALLLALSGLGLLVGVVTVTYNYQPAGTHVAVSSTVAPTASVARHFNSIGVLLEMAEADTTATITHNWGIAANERGQYQPWLCFHTLTSGTALPFLSFDTSGTNAVTVTKSNAAGTSGSWVVVLQRPNTLVR